MINTTRIGNKILFIILPLIIVFSIGLAFGIWGFWITGNTKLRVYNEGVNLVQSLQDLQFKRYQQTITVQKYQNQQLDKETALDKISTLDRDINNTFKAVDRFIDPKNSLISSELDPLVTKLLRENIQKLKKDHSAFTIGIRAAFNGASKLPDLNLDLGQETRVSRLIINRMDEIETRRVRAIGYMVAVFFVGLILSLILSIFVAKDILNPLKTAVVFAKRIAAGERNLIIKSARTDETGELLNAMGSMQSAISKTELLLKGIINYSENLFDLTPVPLMVVDPELRAEAMNKAFNESFPITSKEVLAHPLLRAKLEAVLITSAPLRNWEWIYQTQGSNRQKTFLVNAGKIQRTEAELDQQLLITFQDLSAIKDTERQLIEAKEAAIAASKTKSEFLANVSHEIRTPLNAIVGMGDLLRETSLSSEQLRYVKIFERASATLLTVINDVLDISKVEAGELELESIAFQLDDVVESVAELMAIRAHDKKVELSSFIDRGLRTSRLGDPTRLRQILFNLLGNAVKFTNDGEIFVKVEAKPENLNRCGNILFNVSDTGIGIPPEKTLEIFESFKQVDSSITRKFGGTGLGLAIVKKIVEQMGGEIWVESTVGVGTTFLFTLELPHYENTARSDLKLDGLLSNHRILIVDDKPVNRIILREWLTQWGASVVEADNGMDALRLIKRSYIEKNPYHVMFLDYRMPGLDGIEVSRQVRSEHGQTAPKTVILTSETHRRKVAEIRDENKDVNISAFLVKPIKREDLLNIVQSVLTRENQDRIRKGFKLLLVEDSPDNVELMKAYLQDTQIELTIANDGLEGTDKFQSGRYDLILMDIQMPNMDGYSATRKIREIERAKGFSPTPIWAVTAHAFKDEIEKTKAAGCDGHLAKPVRKSDLIGLLYKISSSRSIQVEPSSTSLGLMSQIEPEILKLVPQYIDNRKADLAILKTAFECQKYEEIAKIGHKIKGSAKSYGLPELGEFGAKLEQSAQLQELHSIKDTLDRMDHLLSEKRRALL